MNLELTNFLIEWFLGVQVLIFLALIRIGNTILDLQEDVYEDEE